jgi:metal-responsive CopG/Arc/MetJ family transcriptional regulator
MDHIVSVGLDTDTLKQLDDLRRAHPNVPSRSEIIKRLIWAAHAKIAVQAAATAPDLAG